MEIVVCAATTNCDEARTRADPQHRKLPAAVAASLSTTVPKSADIAAARATARRTERAAKRRSEFGGGLADIHSQRFNTVHFCTG